MLSFKLLFATNKVGRGQSHRVSLVTRALTYFSKLTAWMPRRWRRKAECIEKPVGNRNYCNEVRQAMVYS